MLLGCDISNYSAVPTEAQTQAWWDAGIRFVCIGLQNTGIARAQQAACSRFWREYYIDRPGRDLTIPEVGTQVWVDLEPGCFERQVDVASAITQLQARGLLPNIYGNQTSITPVIGDSPDFAVFPLVYANYTHRQVIPDFDSFSAFNGWARPRVWQYAGTTDLAGINVDLDCAEGEETEVIGPLVAGIGIHLADGTGREIWTREATEASIDGIGLRLTNGTIVQVWPK